MGAPRAFEGRREELGLEARLEILGGETGPGDTGGRSGGGGGGLKGLERGSGGVVRGGGGAGSGVVGDEEVLLSFEGEAIRPDGLMRRYLEAAQLVVRVGPSLFVHGAIDQVSSNTTILRCYYTTAQLF